MQLTRTHRILIALVVSGAVIIAAIGFAGSYAAVRELAERKGFGDFAVVFPIGIDAGICVLLALDLLLTWLRIPFPMLRQTAWLLTVATIAFNGAASWPDPLGVGMHAVIPVLFVVSVEAARHAVGRIADITADKHMEGVRITRWLLSPIPTFKLWRRMKLWELRSYEQVIKLEQDRLIYQARLQARYGRSWRRKAPVESMMPLRLAKYGVPLAETAPAGLAAAGIEPALLPPNPHVKVERLNEQPQENMLEKAEAQQTESPPQENAGAPSPWFTVARADQPVQSGESDHDDRREAQSARGSAPERQGMAEAHLQGFADAAADAAQPSVEEIYFQGFCQFADAYGMFPGPRKLHEYIVSLYGSSGPALGLLAEDDLRRYTHWFARRYEVEVAPRVESAQGVSAVAHGVEGDEGQAPDSAFHEQGRDAEITSPTAVGERPTDERAHVPHQRIDTDPAAGDLSTVDRYFLAWAAYQQEHGREPKDSELSQYLAAQDVIGRGGAPVNPSTLRRYLLEFRIYAQWAQQRSEDENPSIDLLVKELSEIGVTGQYGRPITQEFVVEKFLHDFERRWQALSAAWSDTTA